MKVIEGIGVNGEMELNKEKKNIIGITQSGLILVLVVLIVFMMVQINRLQGTARVINYAGLVRGATQREVKLEITGNQNEELVQYLDDILSGLKYQDGHYDLVKLHDKEYQDKLQVQSDYWEKLKVEIEAVRSRGYENTDIVNMSEIYFKMADETVFAAEKYSEKIATKIRTIEILSAFDMLCLVILVIVQTLMAMKMAVKNKLLEHRAYTDAHTGLPNKSACKELLGNKEIISEPTACIMFDLNNLKTVNDTMGHSAGDQLILNFARLLRNVIPEKDFVGRYGGDEFMAVIYHTSQTEVEEILKCLCLEKDRLNNREDKMLIDYATIALTAGIMILFILILFLRSNSGILFPIVFLAGALINGLSGIKAFMNKKRLSGVFLIIAAVILLIVSAAVGLAVL